MLTNENYFSKENDSKYMSASQHKTFLDCSARAMAEIRGEYIRPTGGALLVGSYVDAYFEGALGTFKIEHPEIFTQKGELRAEYKQAEEIIARLESDSFFMEHMNGKKQVIQTGEIGGIPFKIKIDVLHDNKIVDLKIIKDFERVWNDKTKQKQNFIEYWGYDIQGAIYQEIERQNRNSDAKLPFLLAAATKEKVTDLAVIEIDREQLTMQINQIKEYADFFQRIKKGEIDPERCEKCDYCKSTKVLNKVVNWAEFM